MSDLGAQPLDGDPAARVLVAGASGFTGALAAQIVWRPPAAASWSRRPRAATPASGSTALPALPGAARADRARPRRGSRGSTPRSSPTRTAPRRRPSPRCAAAASLVVDLSADFRLRDMATYERWYGEHGAPGAVRRARVYGLTELYREELREAELVATPGCYPTASVLGAGAAGRAGPARRRRRSTPSRASPAPGAAAATRPLRAMTENAFPYKTEGHRHRPEIEQELAALGSAGAGHLRPAPAAARPGRAGQLLRDD